MMLSILPQPVILRRDRPIVEYSLESIRYNDDTALPIIIVFYLLLVKYFHRDPTGPIQLYRCEFAISYLFWYRNSSNTKKITLALLFILPGFKRSWDRIVPVGTTNQINSPRYPTPHHPSSSLPLYPFLVDCGAVIAPILVCFRGQPGLFPTFPNRHVPLALRIFNKNLFPVKTNSIVNGGRPCYAWLTKGRMRFRFTR